MMPTPTTLPSVHPIYTQQYAIFTPAIDKMAEQIAIWIEQQKTGGYIHGPSRFGKSRAVQYYLEQLLNERFATQVPLVIWIRQFINRTPGPFFAELLRAAKQPYWNDRHPPLRKQELFMDLLIAMAKRAGGNFVVILIDEAQTMTDQEWQWMLGLQNLLDRAGYRLSVISVGSHQMGYVHQIQTLTGNAHIAARFLVDSAQFHGVLSLDELRFILNGYDEDSEWPEHSGKSYTAAFAPHAFKNKRRLADCAEHYWGIFVSLLPDDYGGRHEVPMQHVARSVETVLKQCAQGMDWDEATSENYLRETVKATGFAEYIRVISALLPKKVR